MIDDRNENRVIKMNQKNSLNIKLLIMEVVFTIVFVALDQLTKYLAILELKGKNPFVLINHVLEFQYLENRGAAFGMLPDQKIFFVIIASIILFVILFVLIKAPDTKHYHLFRFLLVLIASGAIGNMIDRLVRNYVVDFIYFSLIDFPIFNVADIYVTVATTILIIALLFYYKENDFSFLTSKSQLTREVKYTDEK